jgi:TP901 family phage tail tape measure protein
MAETLKFLVEVATEKGEAAVERLTGKFEQLEESGKTAAQSTALEMGKAGVAIGSVGVAISGAMILMATHAAHVGDELHDLALKTGASVEALQVLGFVAENSGSSMEGISTGLKFLAKNSVAAAEGSKEAAEAFAKIGVSVREASGEMKASDKLLLEIADKFAGLRDGAAKTALAIKIFGRSGMEMIPMLNEGREGIEKMGRALEASGAIMSGEAANAADKYNDELHLLEKSTEGITNSIGSVLVPVLREFVEAVQPIVSAIGQWVKAHPDLTKAIFSLALALAGTGGLLVAVSAVTVALPLLAGGLTGAWVAAAGPIAIFAALAAGAFAFRYELGAVILQVAAFISEGLTKLLGALAKVAGAAGFDSLRDKLTGAQKALTDTASSYRDMATQMKAGEPVVIGNTKAVDKWTESHKKALPVVAEMSDEMKAYIKVWVKAADAIYESNKRLKDAVETGKLNMKIQRDSIFLIADLTTKTQGYAGAQFLLGETSKASALVVKESLQKITGEANHAMDDYNARAKKIEEAIKEKRLETYNDLRNSAGQVFDALITKGGNAIGTVVGLFKAGFLSLGRSIFEDITATLFTPLKMAFDDFFTSLLESVGLKKLMSGLATKLGGLLPGVGGGAADAAGGAASAAGGVASAAGGVASSVGGTASSIASSATSFTPAALVGMGLQVAGDIGIIMQLKRIEGTMNAVEGNTRYTSIDTEIIINEFWWPVLGILQRGEDYWHTATMQLDAIYNLMAAANPAALAAVQGSSSTAGPTGTAPATVNIPIEVAATFNFQGDEVNRAMVRDFILPEITTVLVDGLNGVREKWASIFKQTSGLVSTAVTTG